MGAGFGQAYDLLQNWLTPRVDTRTGVETALEAATEAGGLAAGQRAGQLVDAASRVVFLRSRTSLLE